MAWNRSVGSSTTPWSRSCTENVVILLYGIQFIIERYIFLYWRIFAGSTECEKNAHNKTRGSSYNWQRTKLLFIPFNKLVSEHSNMFFLCTKAVILRKNMWLACLFNHMLFSLCYLLITNKYHSWSSPKLLIYIPHHCLQIIVYVRKLMLAVLRKSLSKQFNAIVSLHTDLPIFPLRDIN